MEGHPRTLVHFQSQPLALGESDKVKVPGKVPNSSASLALAEIYIRPVSSYIYLLMGTQKLPHYNI